MGCVARLKQITARLITRRWSPDCLESRIRPQFIAGMLLAMNFGFPSSAAMAAGEEVSELEFASLPPYCRARLKAPRGSAEWESWASRIPEFPSIHHYCVGLNFMNRARAQFDLPVRGSYLNRAVNEMGYNLKGPKPEAVLTATIFLNRAAAYEMWKRPGEAIRDLISAIQYDPRLEQAYDRLAALLERSSGRKQALEIVTQGLQYVPSSERLKSRYLALGGKLPFPAPFHATEQDGEPDQGTEAAEEDAHKDTQSEPRSVPPEAAEAAEEPTPSEGRRADGRDGRSCRFCAVDELDRPSKAQAPGRSCRFCADVD